MNGTLLFTIASLFSFHLNAQNYTEGADLSNVSPGLTFTFSGPKTTIAGQMNTPADGIEYWVIDLGSGCQIDSVNYEIEDPQHVGVTGFFQFGTNNQESYNFPGSYSFANAGQFPTVPFPLTGPATIQCAAQANIAATSDWKMEFHGSCTPCTDPDVPGLSSPNVNVCAGNEVDINISGNLNDAIAWEVYTGGCGGNKVGSTATNSFTISPSDTTTYYFRGEGGCVSPGSCNSITIYTSDPISASINMVNDTLFSNILGATYQWVDCDNSMMSIPGETDYLCAHCLQNDGNYAVIIDKNGCVDTSNCIMVDVTALDVINTQEFLFNFDQESHKIIVNLQKEFTDLAVSIYDLQGREVYSNFHKRSTMINATIENAAGLYIIKVTSGENPIIDELFLF